MAPSSSRSTARGPGPHEHRIQAEIDARVAYYARHPEAIDARLAELDAEWDVERVLEANAAAMSLIGAGISAFSRRRWIALGVPGAVAAFLLHHAVRGFRPPLAVLRRFGFRTMEEIDRERMALRVLRGDVDAAIAGRPEERRPPLATALARLGLQSLRR